MEVQLPKFFLMPSLEIALNVTLRDRLASYTTNVADGNSFGLHHFTYNNPEFLEVMFNNLHNLQFEGIIVSLLDNVGRVSPIQMCYKHESLTSLPVLAMCSAGRT